MSIDSKFRSEDYIYHDEDGVALIGTLLCSENHNLDTILIDVHGGAWTQGDRFSNAAIHEKLVAMGIAIFAIDFRMGPQFKFPNSIIDINKAVRWLKSNIRTMGINPHLFGGLGTSSGGHQIILSALLPKDVRYLNRPETINNNDASLDFVIAGWPILDPFERYEMAKNKKIEFLIKAHDDYWPTIESMKDGNPMLIMKDGRFTSLPPIMILQGMSDENVNHIQSDQFKLYYEKSGGMIDLIKLKNQPHAFLTKSPDCEEAQYAFERIKHFIEQKVAIS
jgi:acetyl esterase/lipase